MSFLKNPVTGQPYICCHPSTGENWRARDAQSFHRQSDKPSSALGLWEPLLIEEQFMRQITLKQLADILEVMTITQSIDDGFAITHHGRVEGQPTIAISTWGGDGGCYIIQ